MAIIQAPQGQSFTDKILQVLLGKQELEQRKEDLRIRQGDFKLRQDEAAAAAADREASLAGIMSAAQFILGQNPALAQAAEGLSTPALGQFLQSTQGFQQAQGAITGQGIANEVAAGTAPGVIAGANARNATDVGLQVPRIIQGTADASRAATEARVASATADDRIAGERANLLSTNLQNQFRAAQLANDPQRFGEAFNAWVQSDGQMTWGEATGAVGASPGTISPELRYAPPQNVSADASRATAYLPLMQEANNNINALNSQGVRLELLGGLQQATRVGSFDALFNIIQDETQQQLIQANRAFADYYRFSLSGQASGEAERLAMMLSITEQVGDDDATLSAKRRLREIMIGTMAQRARGGMTNLEAANAALAEARRLGNEDAIAAFEGLVADIDADATGAAATIPGAGSGIGAIPGIVDATLGGL